MNAKQLWSVLAVATCAALLAGALAGCSGASASTDSDITVTATSDAKIVPDKARINVSVVSEEKTAEACQKENATRVNAVIEKLGGLGVADTSIQTANTYLFPRYGQPKDASEDDEYAITGYEMTTTLRVEDLDIDNVGTVIQACVAEGANQADGIEFYASTYDEAYQQALEAALGTARNKAEGIANASGVNLGSIVRVSEGYQDTSARYISNLDVYASEDAVDSGAATAKTMPGQTTITAEVTVTYAIR